MKRLNIALVVAAASLAAGSALAGDISAPVEATTIGEPSYLGMKRGGRYVPAPRPVPETFNWYVRLDLGVGTTSGGGSESGMVHGLGSGAGYAREVPITSNPGWYDAGDNAFFQGGIGFGKYFSPRFRMDFTVDVKTADENGANERDRYIEFNQPLALGGAATGNEVIWTLRDRVDVTDGIGLVNAYLDLVPRGRFTPYVGIGAGFAVRYIDRTHTTHERIVDPGNFDAVIGERSFGASFNETKVAPAISATAGLAWAITPGTILDVNYRYTYVGSVDSTMSINVPGVIDPVRSKVTVSESHQHALRAGLRWNIW